MMKRHQTGVLLLSVSVALAFIAAAAFLVNREAAMGAEAIVMQKETDAARYLAEAGLNHAKWKANSVGCSSYSSIGTISGSLAGVGSYTATVTPTSGNTMTIVATGTTLNGSAATLKRLGVIPHDMTQRFADLNADRDASIKGSGSDSNTNFGGSDYLEVSSTGGSANAVLHFNLPSDVKNDGYVLSATLSLYQVSTANAVPADISVHRLLADFEENKTTWVMAGSNPWALPGGDYAPGAVAVATVGPASATYSWNVTSIVEGWAHNGLANPGLLVKPYTSMSTATFGSRQNSTGSRRPVLSIAYRKKC